MMRSDDISVGQCECIGVFYCANGCVLLCQWVCFTVPMGLFYCANGCVLECQVCCIDVYRYQII